MIIKLTTEEAHNICKVCKWLSKDGILCRRDLANFQPIEKVKKCTEWDKKMGGRCLKVL